MERSCMSVAISSKMLVKTAPRFCAPAYIKFLGNLIVIFIQKWDKCVISHYFSKIILQVST